ncbi:hypothetical protein Patl1_24965 [Pistacia atlantica]|uniref:Uncharacterized protein n=1 Tax=Pistacia atlantica TaxID=434234 RepID=A0ACC1B1X5_9ROSI|nr:hypothetical protein Patl1_24965 [Pistacia atlantica]
MIATVVETTTNQGQDDNTLAVSRRQASALIWVMPQAIKSVELIEGDGGAGSIGKVNLVEGNKPASMKHKIDALDKESDQKWLVIMGVVTDELEVTCAHPPAKMFKAFVLEADNLFRKVLPQEVKSGELLEGDEGVGSIKKVTFVEGDKTTYLKHKIDAIDKENFVFCYTSFEGDFLVNKFEKISHETKVGAIS